MPPEMERQDEVGAVAAAEYFMALYEYVLGTGDARSWIAASGNDCTFCSGLVTSVNARYADGGRFSRPSATRYAGYSVTSHDPSVGLFGVELTFASAGVTSINADGSIASSGASEAGTLVLAVLPAARGWVLLGGSAESGQTP